MEAKTESNWQQNDDQRFILLYKLLSSIQNHILADYVKREIFTNSEFEIDILGHHLQCVFPLAANIFKKAAGILEKHPSCLELLYNVLLVSPGGAMLMKILNSLLLMPAKYMNHKTDDLLGLLEPLDRLNCLLPTDVQNVDSSTSGNY